MIAPSIPDPPVYPEGATSIEVLRHVDQAIAITWEALLANARGDFDEGTPHQMRDIIDRLFIIREELVKGEVPEQRSRLANSRAWIFMDAWDRESRFGRYVGIVMFLYDHKLIRGRIPPDYQNARSDMIRMERIRQRTAEDELVKVLPTQVPGTRKMPHHPDQKSLMNYLQACDSAISLGLPEEPKSSGSKRFFLGQQYFVRGRVWYWLERPGSDVVGDIRAGSRLCWSGIKSGYPAHIWNFQYLFLDSVAVRMDNEATGIIDSAEDAWNLSQTRPVPWLTARLRCMFTLHQHSKVAIGAYFEDFRLAAFVDKMLPELEKDVPLIHNSYRLLVALRDQAWPTLEERLAERMDLLVKHFWRQVTPTALVDTFGLSVARWARERGYQVQLQHVYLPLDWLDVPVDAKPAG